MTATNQPTESPIEGSSSTAGKPSSTTGPEPSKVFRILSWVFALFITALWIFGLAEIVLMWLPDDTLVSLLGDGDPDPIELEWRGQFFYIGIAAWTLVPPLFAQLRRPQRRVAAMLQGWLGWIAAVLVLAVTGGLEPIDFVVLAIFTLLAVLHPARREMLRRPSFDRWQVGILAVGVIPWMVRAVVGIGDARDADGLPDVGDTAAHMVASNVSIAVVAMLIAGLLGASDHSSWKLPAWTAGLSSVLLGVHALVFHDQAAAIAAPWAVAAIGWGAVYLAATVNRARRTTPAA